MTIKDGKVVFNDKSPLDAGFAPNGWYIYVTICLITGKYYVGQRKPPLGILPEKDKYLGSGIILKKAIKKYGKELFYKLVLIKEIADKRYADLLEYWLIKTMRECHVPNYNIADGGQGGLLSEASREKRKIALKGHAVSDETRKKIGDSHRGLKWSNEAKERKSEITSEKFMAFGYSKSIRQWAQLTGLSEVCLRGRIAKGIPFDIAISVGSNCILDFFVVNDCSGYNLKNQKYTTEWAIQKQLIHLEEIKQRQREAAIVNWSKSLGKDNGYNFITAFGVTKIEKEWISITHQNRGTLRQRLKKGVKPEIALGYESNCILRFFVDNDETIEKKSFITAFGITLRKHEWSKLTGLRYTVFNRRIENGHTPEYTVAFNSNCILRFFTE